MMKRSVALLLTFLPVFALIVWQPMRNSRAPAGQSIKAVIFDLDGTLVESLGHGVSGDVTLSSGESYKIFAHAQALVEMAYEQGLEVHFFSGGPKARNLDLLSRLKLSNGSSFLDIAVSTHHFEDLTDLGDRPNAKYFTDRYRKDLSKVGELKDLVLIDDNRYFPLNEKQLARTLVLPVESEDALNVWKKEQRLAWAYESLKQVIAGEDVTIVNKKSKTVQIANGLKNLGGSAQKSLSQHDCAGIFYGLKFSY